MSLNQRAQRHLDDWTAQGLMRTIRAVPSTLIDAASSDYLGLGVHPEVLTAGRAALSRAGSTGSRLTTGTFAEIEALESELAAFFGFDDSIFFATGYQANVSTLHALGETDVTIFSDASNHASIIDGTRLAKAAVKVYPHLDYDTLDGALAERSTPHALVVSDGLFSMGGDVADLTELRRVCDAHGAWLMVDDAHGVGTLGATGRGIVEAYSVRPDVLVGTASKALGGEGGFVCASTEVVAWLRQRARGFVFSTAPSPATVACARAALRVLDEHPELVRSMRMVARILGCEKRPDHLTGPIVPVHIGDESQAVHASAVLNREGFHVSAIRFPTVPRSAAILRLCARADFPIDDAYRLRSVVDRVANMQS